MQKNRILINSLLSLLYYGINMFTNFWITSLLIGSLGKDVYSFYPLANNVSGWMIIISSAINSMLARHISVQINKNDIKQAEKYYSTAMVVDFVIGMLIIIPILFISQNVDGLFNVPKYCVSDVKKMFLMVLLTVPIDMIMTVFSTSWTLYRLVISQVGNKTILIEIPKGPFGL